MSARKCQCRCCRERDGQRRTKRLERLADTMDKAAAAGLVFEPTPDLQVKYGPGACLNTREPLSSQAAPAPEMEREDEEFPPRAQWTEQEKETCGPQTIMEMRWVACTPEQYKLVFQNIAHANGYRDVLSAQYDKLLYLFAEWVTDLQLRRMDQYNVRIGERNKERNTLKAQLSAQAKEVERLRAVLKEIREGNALMAEGEGDEATIYQEMAEHWMKRADLALAPDPSKRGEGE